MDDWPTSHDVARQKADEAAHTAAQLGHKLTGWILKVSTWYARCVVCHEAAEVRPGRLGHAIVGAATFLRCRARRAVSSLP